MAERREKLREKWPRDWPVGRWIVIAAATIGAAWWAQRTVGASRSLYQGFLEGIAAAFVVSVLLGNFERRWQGARQKRSELSAIGGASEEFEEATEETVATLNAKMNALFNDLNARLDEIERQVLGESGSAPDADR